MAARVNTVSVKPVKPQTGAALKSQKSETKQTNTTTRNSKSVTNKLIFAPSSTHNCSPVCGCKPPASKPVDTSTKKYPAFRASST